MTKPFFDPLHNNWLAFYVSREGWTMACDALGRPIRCETERLALSVAKYRRRRLKKWRS